VSDELIGFRIVRMGSTKCENGQSKSENGQKIGRKRAQ